MGKSSGGGSAKQEVNEYYMSMHMGLCSGPIDKLLALFVGEKPAWTGEASSEQTINVNQPNLFGGRKKEGGVVGDIHFRPGDLSAESQPFPENLASRFNLTSDTCPEFTGLANLFFTKSISSASGGFYWVANNPYLKNLWATVQRIPKTLPGPGMASYASIGPDANPAHMIYECLTNRVWGMGGSPSSIDLSSFQYAAKVFHREAFGLSMVWKKQDRIENFIAEIIDHTESSIFLNPLTGLITLKPIRDDYDASDLFVLDPSNCTVTDFQRKAWGETINEIIVSWKNPENEEDQTITVHDLANIEIQGDIVSEKRDYYGIRNSDLATQVALRDLRSAAVPLASFEIEADRTAWGVSPGGVVKLFYPEHGINGLVLRVGTVDYGKLGDSKIKISAVEDVFGLPQSAYTTPSESGWQSEAREPTELEHKMMLTLPYYFTARAVDLYAAAVPEEPEVYMGVLASSENIDTVSYEIYGDVPVPSGGTEIQPIGTKPILGRTLTRRALPAEAETTLSGAEWGLDAIGVGTPPLLNGFAMIGDGEDGETEIALITALEGDFSSMAIRRGVLDTVPRKWQNGVPITFFDRDVTWAVNNIYTSGETVTFRALPSTSLGRLSYDDALDFSEVASDRPYLPLRPASVAVEGQTASPVFLIPSTDYAVTWSRRNRTTEDSVIQAWDAGDVTPESGQETKIEVLAMDRTVLNTHTGITGTSFSVPDASFSGNNAGIIRVSSTRDGLESLQAYEIVVSFGTGYGTDYGNNYGDV